MLLIQAYRDEAVLLRRAGKEGAARRLEALASKLAYLTKAFAR